MNNKKERKKMLGKKKLLIGAIGAIAAGVIGILPRANVSAVTTWGPERPTYTWAAPSDHVTFNSITDNPSIGDERNFVRVGEAGSSTAYTDSIDLQVGKTYEVYVYYHNNASASLNASGAGMAQNVRVKMEQPELLNAGHAGEIKGIIKSSNATPTEVWDTAYVHSSSTVYMRYVANSAVIHNGGTGNGLVLDSTALFGSDGAKIGHSKNYWGYVPGCNEYAGYITYQFTVDQPGFTIAKTAQVNGAEYAENVTAKPGDTVNFKIEYENTGTVNQQNITWLDTMPNGLTYVQGSAKFTASYNNGETKLSDNLTNGGINMGDTKPGDKITVYYQAKVSEATDVFPCGETVVYNTAKIATANGSGEDKVEIKVVRNCDDCNQHPDTPECKCVVNPDLNECKATPTEIPSTGPGEIVLAVVVVLAIGGGTFYYVRSRKQIKATKEKAGVRGVDSKEIHKK